MARSASIIVGGGIQAGTPFTVGSLALITSASPPQVADSIAFQRVVGATTVITINGNDYPAATETLKVTDGLISDTGATAGVLHDNVILGRAAATKQVANARNVVIGTEASSGDTANALNNVVIGWQAAVATGVDTGTSVAIGSQCVIGGAGVGAVVAIAPTSTIGAPNGFSGVAIGAGMSVQGFGVAIGNSVVCGNVGNFVAIGRLAKAVATGQTALGDNAQPAAGHTNAIAIGRNAVTIAANSLNIGATNVAITTVLIGGGDTQAAYPGIEYRHTNGNGVDDVVGALTVTAPRCNGAGVGGDFVVKTGELAASGAGVQAATERFRLVGGINGAGNAPVVLFSNIGSTDAGAQAGTLLNAPTAGNPAFWWRIKLNGTNYAIPCWTM